MIRRILAMSIVVGLVSVSPVWADDPGGEDIVVPPPAVVVVEEEEAVTAAPPPYVSMQSRSIAAGIGLSWGEGVLGFEGQRHSFTVKGVSLLDLGIAKMISEGSVSNLEELSDFEGRYIAIEAGIAAGVGASALTMRNQNGVVITLHSEVEGVQLALGPEGLDIALD